MSGDSQLGSWVGFYFRPFCHEGITDFVLIGTLVFFLLGFAFSTWVHLLRPYEIFCEGMVFLSRLPLTFTESKAMGWLIPMGWLCSWFITVIWSSWFHGYQFKLQSQDSFTLLKLWRFPKRVFKIMYLGLWKRYKGNHNHINNVVIFVDFTA